MHGAFGNDWSSRGRSGVFFSHIFPLFALPSLAILSKVFALSERVVSERVFRSLSPIRIIYSEHQEKDVGTVASAYLFNQFFKGFWTATQVLTVRGMLFRIKFGAGEKDTTYIGSIRGFPVYGKGKQTSTQKWVEYIIRLGLSYLPVCCRARTPNRLSDHLLRPSWTSWWTLTTGNAT